MLTKSSYCNEHMQLQDAYADSHREGALVFLYSFVYVNSAEGRQFTVTRWHALQCERWWVHSNCKHLAAVRILSSSTLGSYTGEALKSAGGPQRLKECVERPILYVWLCQLRSV